MPELADVAHALTDAAVAHLAAVLPFVTAGALALAGVIVASLGWLCYTELHGTADDRKPVTNDPLP